MVPANPARNPSVFISYSQDSPDHSAKVLALADWLRSKGVDASIDQYEQNPVEGWPHWTQKQIGSSDFVVVVCTQPYRRRVEKKESIGVGLGATWEGQLIYNCLYEAQGVNNKFVPVLISENDKAGIPGPLAQSQHYLVDREERYWDLYRALTHQPLVDKPELGTIISLPARNRKIAMPSSPVEIASSISFSRGFPSRPVNEIPRDNIVNTLKTQAASIRFVVVEGAEGAGKTTLLSQIARRFCDTTASVFLSSDDRASFDRETIAETLAYQFYWLLHESPRPHGRADLAEVQGYAEELRRLSRRSGKKFMIIIDGLSEVGALLPGGPKSILEIFPQLGLDAFTFVVSGDLGDLQPAIGRAIKAKSFPVIDFGIEDSIHFFEGVVDQRELLARLHHASEGLPARLASLRRLIISGVSVETLLDTLERRKVNLFHFEWEQRDRRDDQQQRLLAQLCYDDKRHTESALSDTTQIPVATIRGWTSKLTFLGADQTTGEIWFRSPWFRRQAQFELQRYRTSVHKKIVRQLLTPNSDDSQFGVLSHLEASTFPELLKNLTPDYIIEILRRTGSFSKVEQTVEAGLIAARREERDTESLRFGINKSILVEFLSFGADASEVMALAALGDYKGALAIARATVPKEDKLHYLAITASQKVRRRDVVEPELLEQIASLAGQIDTKRLGNRTLEICEQLITVAPELALSLAESLQRDPGDRDRALAKLSVMALEALDQARSEKTLERIKASGVSFQIDLMQKLYSAVSGKWTPAEAIAHAGKQEKTRDRLFLLRSWIRWNQAVEGSAAVLEFALEVAIKATDFTINATVLRELAEGLANVVATELVRSLIGRFDGQKATAQLLGPSLDYVRLQLLLAEAESRYDSDSAENRFLSLFYEITQIPDLAVRSESWAWLLSAIEKARPVLTSGGCDAVRADSLRELEDSFLELLDSTADHYRAAGEVIEAAARFSPAKAIELSRMLNTEQRRDSVLVDIAEIIVSKWPAERACEGLTQLLQTCVDTDYRDEAVTIALKAVADLKDCTSSQAEAFSFLFIRAKSISNASRRTRALGAAYFFVCKIWTPAHNVAVDLLKDLWEAWSSITTGSVRVHAGFALAQSLATAAPETALAFVRQTEETKRQLGGLSSEKACNVYSLCIRLASRAFAGLVRRHHNTKQDINLLAAQIEAIPSPGEKALLWAELALKCSYQTDDDICREIYNEKIVPSLAAIPASDAGYLALVTTRIAPAAFIANSNACWERLATLDRVSQDIACIGIINFLFDGSLPSDPDEYLPGTGYETNYGKLSQICDVLEHLSWDSVIYATIEKIVDSLLSRKNELRLKQGQKDELFRRMSEIVSKQLPAKGHIAHNGYKIIAQAQLSRYRTEPEIKKLVDAASHVPNTADRALVLFDVALVLPKSDRALADKIIAEAAEIVRKLPSNLDRLDRFIGFASAAKTINSSVSRQMLIDATRIVTSKNTNVDWDVRRIIDIAYNIDKSFAEEIADKLDGDKAKQHARKEIELLEIKQRVIDEELIPEKLKMASSKEYESLGLMLLGSNIESVKLASTIPCVDSAAQQPLSVSYNVLAWIIENAVARHADTDRGAQYLRPIYEAVLASSELAGQMARQAFMKQHSTWSPQVSGGSNTEPLERYDRQQFFEFLPSWVSEAGAEIIVCDALFGREQLEILRLIRAAGSGCRVKIVTSKISQTPTTDGLDLGQAYLAYWKDHISEQRPPKTRIVLLSRETDGRSPVPEIVILGEASGLRLGTSLNDFGLNKADEMVRLDISEAAGMKERIERLISGESDDLDGTEVRCATFTM